VYITCECERIIKNIATLELAKDRSAMEPQVLLAMGDAYYGDKNQILLSHKKCISSRRIFD
jgi:hypothetical protein